MVIKTDEKRRNRKFLLLYTLLFGLSALLAFHYFPETGKRMVWKRDGLTQHYVALRYYAVWARSVLRSLLAGKPVFPTYNLHIGFGSDLFTTFQYYVIGDPFSLPAVLVPQKYLLPFHDAMILLRLYLAGVCFDRYCCAMGRRSLTGNLCGALLYVFGNFTLFGMRHPYFLNALIWFPLLLLGAERILREKKGGLFTTAVFLSCISNFYFFYMLVLLTVIYVVWRALRTWLLPCLSGRKGGERSGGPAPDRSLSARPAFEIVESEPETGFYPGNGRPGTVGEAWKKIGETALCFFSRGLLGVGLGMCLFLPVVLRFLQDPRISEGPAYAALYPAEYYLGFPEAFLSFGTKKALEYWTCLGYGAVGLLGVLVLFLLPGKKNRQLKAAWCGMLVMMLLPAAGAVLNGFSYPSNRWGWAFSLLTAYIAAAMVPEIPALSRGRMAVLFACLGVYAAACGAGGAPLTTMTELVIAGAAALAVRLLAPAKEQERGEKLRTGAAAVRRSLCSCVLVCAVLATAGIHGYVCFEKGRRNSDINQYKTDNYIGAMVASDAAGVRKIADEIGEEGFFRYSGRDLANNFSVLHNVSNTQYFWSLSDSSVVRFFTETGQANESVHIFDNLDNRTMLDEVAGVKYYIRSDGSLLPFGYHRLEGHKFDNRNLYPQEEEDPLPVFSFAMHENEYALPLGFTSERAISRTDWEALSLPRRQEALLQGIVLEDADVERYGLRKEEGETELSFTEKELTGLSFTEKELTELPQAEEGIEISRTEDGQLQFKVLDKDVVVRLAEGELEQTAGCETSVLFTDMSYAELSPADVERAAAILAAKTGEDLAKISRTPAAIETLDLSVKAKRNGETVSAKDVSYSLADNPWSTGRDDFLSCCGYSDDPLEAVTVKFPRRGVYTFREFKVVCQPMEDYPAQAEELRSCTLEDLDLHELPQSGATSRITGRITVPQAEEGGSGRRILCLQIPCSRGLQAFVDGQKAPLLQADTMFSALVLEPGTHEIELRYCTPGLAAGTLVSVGTAGAILFVFFLRRRRKKL